MKPSGRRHVLRQSPPGRRWRMVLIVGTFFVAMFAAAAAGWYYARVSAPPSGPLVMVSIDGLHAERLPAYGYTKTKTPAIDAVASDGTVFEHAYAHSPLTLASHVALLSGLLPFENGVRDDVGFTVPSRVKLLPSLLGDRGWATAGIVSSFLLRAETGIDGGFDFFDCAMPPTPGRFSPGPVERTGLESFEVARDWMDGQDSPRFFLFLHVNEPQFPQPPHEASEQRSGDNLYDSDVAAADEVIGHLTAYLARRGWYDEATIILLSDHGESFGDQGEGRRRIFLSDETLRVPLIVKLPGREGAGRRISTPVQHIDLVPTILDWLGAPRPSGLRGRSLRELLDRGRDSMPGGGFYAESLHARYQFGWSDIYALTDGGYRYVLAPRPELYDLGNDPDQARNIVEEEPEIAERMREALERMLPDTSPEAPAEPTEAELRRFGLLGYGRPSLAARLAPSARLADPKDKAALIGPFRRAVSLGAAGRHDEAVAILSALVRRDPEMKAAWLQLAREQRDRGQLEEAARDYGAALAIGPPDPAVHVELARVLQRLGRLDEAMEHALTARRIARPDEAAARLAAGETLVGIALARKDAASARRHAKAAAGDDSSFPLPVFVEGRLLFDEGNYEEALEAFQQAAAALAGTPGRVIEGLWYYTGESLRRLERQDEAEKAFENELAVSPRHLDAAGGLAAVYMAQGRSEEAAALLDAMLAAVPTREAYTLAAGLWTSFGHPDRAAVLRSEARRLGSRRAQPAPRSPVFPDEKR